ncbi:PREDICTED: growth/differentiation factor 15 [Cercocebus atys]|uniref:Growth/differentiation factor 15 n=1 Tax=Cercocebus atys TaxID=9531 RepID=A0A2K5NSE4_CERAT|nr:PREDICTED: growth/differentiation factor 15 [Cercocebus atys]XP_011949815.1 PREDICTED: growth/differentiation factor 15 [Cercocebus atys]
MPGQELKTLNGSQMLLVLLVLLRPPHGGAVSLAEASRASFPGPSDLHSEDSRFRELRKRYEDLLTRLRANQSWEDSNTDLIQAPEVRILTPEVRLGSGGHLHLRISRAVLPEGLPEASRIHRALFRLSPTASRSWDVTRPLRRQLRLARPQAPALHLRLSPPPSQSDQLLVKSSSARPQLELHLRPRAARGRRRARARNGDHCPLGPGRCCRLHTVHASLEDLGWADWVLSPREVQVTMCIGACPSQFREANMHAQIKMNLHRLKPDTVPAPCCVPASYNPMVLIQKTDTGVSLQTYDDLLAKDCHCV